MIMMIKRSGSFIYIMCMGTWYMGKASRVGLGIHEKGSVIPLFYIFSLSLFLSASLYMSVAAVLFSGQGGSLVIVWIGLYGSILYFLFFFVLSVSRGSNGRFLRSGR